MKISLIVQLLIAADVTIALKKKISFPVHVYRNTITDHPDTNIVISPPLIKISMSMLMMGLVGSAEKEIYNGLQLEYGTKSAIAEHIFKEELGPLLNVSHQIANGIYIDKNVPVLPAFTDTARKYFQGEVKAVSQFTEATRQEIEAWMAQKIGEKGEVISKREFESPTTMVLSSGINFNGGISGVFHMKNTNKKAFRENRLNSKKVDMMRTRGEFAKGYLKEWDANAVLLPYLNDDIYMLILLPSNKAVEFNDNKANRALENMEFKMLDLSLYNLNSKLLIDTIEVHLPRFKIQFSTNLDEVIRQLGIKKVFDDGAANFSSFTTNAKDLSVVVVHKAVMNIDEMGKKSLSPTQPAMTKRNIERFIVNRPFFFAVLDLKTVYLMGHVIHF